MEQQLRQHEDHHTVALELAAYVAGLRAAREYHESERDPPAVVRDVEATLGTTAVQLMLPLEWGEPVTPAAPTIGRAALNAVRRTFTQVVEIADGRRSAFSLYGYLSDGAYTGLTEHTKQAPPQFAARLRSVHAQHPAPEVIEACALVDRGPYVQAVVARFERQRRRWIGTVLQWL